MATEFEIIEEIREGIFNVVEHLGIEVTHFPDEPDTYQLANANGAVLISSGASNYSNTENKQVQIQLMTIKIYTLSHKLAHDNSIYALSDIVEDRMDKTIVERSRPYLLTKDEPNYFPDQFWVREIIYLLPLTRTRKD